MLSLVVAMRVGVHAAAARSHDLRSHSSARHTTGELENAAAHSADLTDEHGSAWRFRHEGS